MLSHREDAIRELKKADETTEIKAALYVAQAFVYAILHLADNVSDVAKAVEKGAKAIEKGNK